MKIDLSDPNAIAKAGEFLVSSIRSAHEEREQLRSELVPLWAAPLNEEDLKAELAARVRLARDQAAARLNRDLDAITFLAVSKGAAFRSTAPTPSIGAEPHVPGLHAGDAILCLLLENAIVDGYAAAIKKRDFSTAGPSRDVRLRKIADIEARIAELDEAIERLEGQARAIAGLAPLPAEAESEAAQREQERIDRILRRGAPMAMRPGEWADHEQAVRHGATAEEATDFVIAERDSASQARERGQSHDDIQAQAQQSRASFFKRLGDALAPKASRP